MFGYAWCLQGLQCVTRGTVLGSAGSDNTQYDGEWRANMRQGIGTALYEDGR
jgi:hypothetical protein